MKKNFYVCDSYHTESIATRLKETFPESTIFTNSTISVIEENPLLNLINKNFKSLIEGDQKESEVNDKIDFFVLSARLIIERSVIPKQLKKKYGNNISKSIAVSVSPSYLHEVKDLVDFTCYKDDFLNYNMLIEFFKDKI